MRNLGLFDPESRCKDIWGAINTDTVIDVNKHIEFYEGCLNRKGDPYLPTYRLVLERLKARLRELLDGVSKL